MDENDRKLLRLLSGLPLALAQAASYLREAEVSTELYVRLYKEQWDDLMRSDSERGAPLVDYEKSIRTTWTVSFKAIEAKSMNAANLLRLWAFLDNNDLWHGLLQAVTGNPEKWPGWLREIACNEVNFLDATKLLLRYSMIEARQSVQDSYIMHPVVHRWASHIQGDVKRDFIRLAGMVVGYSVPDRMSEDYWLLGRRLLPHADRCLWWMGEIYKGGWPFDDIATTDSIHICWALSTWIRAD